VAPTGGGLEPLPARWVWFLTVAASIAVVGAVLVAPYLPSQDGPQHLYLAHLSIHYSDPGSIYAETYRPTQAVTAQGFNFLYSPLAELLPWRRALQVTLGIILLGWSWAFVALTRALRPERFVLGLLGFATAFQWALYMGFFSFLISTSVSLAIIALALRFSTWDLRHRVLLGVLVTLQGVFHLFGAQVTLLFLGVLTLVRHERGRWLREVGTLALISLPIAWLVARTAGAFSASSNLPSAGPDAPLPVAERLLLIRGVFVGGPAWRGWPVFVLALVALASWSYRWRRGRGSRDELALGVTSALLLSAGVLAPLHLATWQFFSPRFLPLGVMLALPLLSVEALTRRFARLASVGAIVLFSGASLAWSGWFNRAAYEQCRNSLAGLEQPIRRQGYRLPVVLQAACERDVHPTIAEAYPFVEPVTNIGALYAVEQGGVVPYTFTARADLHPFVLTDQAKASLPPVSPRSQFWWVYENRLTRLDERARFPLTTTLASQGSRFEDVLFHGLEEDRQVFLQRGFRTVWDSGKMAILQFEGCTLDLTVESAAEPKHPTLLEYSWFPSDSVFSAPPILAKAFAGTGTATASLRGVPCGVVRLRVFVDEDESADLSAADTTCERSEQDGAVLFDVSRESPHFRCRLPPKPVDRPGLR